MSIQKSALGYMWQRAKKDGPYSERASHSCKKEFAPAWPTNKKYEFVADDLIANYNGKLFKARPQKQK